MFLQKEKINLGKVKPGGGLLLLYIKAQKEGLKQSSPKAMTGNEEESFSEDEDGKFINRIIEDIFTDTADYDDEFLKELRKETKVSKNVISNLLGSLHYLDNKERVQKLCQTIIFRTGARSKDEILSQDFNESVEKKIISSKKQEDVIEIKDMCDDFIKIVYKRKNEFRALSAYKKHHLKKSINLED